MFTSVRRAPSFYKASWVAPMYILTHNDHAASHNAVLYGSPSIIDYRSLKCPKIYLFFIFIYRYMYLYLNNKYMFVYMYMSLYPQKYGKNNV